MAVRRFGVTRALGIAVEEKEGGKPITPAQLGTVLLIGESDRTPGDLPVVVSSKRQAWRFFGGYRPGSYLMDAIDGFFAENRGGGRLYVMGLGPGKPEKARNAYLYLWPRGIDDEDVGPIAKITAKSPGKWAGRKNYYVGQLPAQNDMTDTTLKVSGANWIPNQWAGANVYVAGDDSHVYQVVSNTQDTLTFAPGSKFATNVQNLGNAYWMMFLDTDSKHYLAVRVGPGKVDPTHFSLEVLIDGEVVKVWDDLSMDQNAPNYAPAVINSDPTNYEIEMEDLRPSGVQYNPGQELANMVYPIANISGTQIEVYWYLADWDDSKFPYTATAPAAYKPMLAVIEVTVDNTDTSKFAWKAKFGIGGTLPEFGENDPGDIQGTGTFGTEVEPPVDFLPKFKIEDPDNNAEAGARLGFLSIVPLMPGLLKGATVYPGYNYNNPLDAQGFVVKDNTYNTITVAYGDPSNNGQVGEDDGILISGAIPLEGGRDGEPYDAASQVDVFSRLADVLDKLPGFEDAGLVKIAAPGWTNAAVQKAGISLAERYSYQYRVEIPPEQAESQAALKWIYSNIGRSDFAVVNWPSYGYVLDPEKAGQVKLVPITGDILGVEAAIAKDYLGYHRPAAGVDAVLHRIVDLALEDVINEEMLSPAGINIIKKYQGNYIIWGFRTLSQDPNWKWKNQREQMSYYERILLSQFNWIIAMLNDRTTWGLLKASLLGFFRNEWRKGALVGDTFDKACVVKIDEENNPPDTQEQGDLYADITLHLPTAVERVTFRIGKAGITEL